MYAIIECGGKQYRVAEGDVVRVEKLDAAVGENVSIEQVLMIGGDNTVVGTPTVDGAAVSCKVLMQDKEKKVLVFHYKAKKNIRKRYGHRQPFTALLVEKILVGQAPKKAAKAETAETVEVKAEAKPKTATKATAEKATVAKKTTTATAAKKTTATKKAAADGEKPKAAAKSESAKKTATTTAKKTTAAKKPAAKKSEE